MKRIFGLLFALFYFVIAAVLLKYGGEGLWREYSARSWPTTKGIVKSASIVVSEGRTQTLWCPNWEYHYLVKPGQGYKSTRTALGTFSCEKSRQSAEKKLGNRPINSVVDVIYDPDNPSISALYISEDGGFFWWFLLFSGAGVLVAGGLFVNGVLQQKP